MNLNGLIQIGTIFNSHGVRGEVKVSLLTEDSEMLSSLEEVTFFRDGNPERLTVTRSRPQKENWLLQFAEVTDMDQAKALKGTELFVPEELIQPLEEGEYFLHDVIDKTVFDQEGNELGRVTSFFENGDQIVFEVKGRHDFLFPGTEEILLEIDPEAGRVVINAIEGLIDLNHGEEGSKPKKKNAPKRQSQGRPTNQDEDRP